MKNNIFDLDSKDVNIVNNHKDEKTIFSIITENLYTNN